MPDKHDADWSPFRKRNIEARNNEIDAAYVIWLLVFFIMGIVTHAILT